jgi:hypothetical protein
MLMLTSLGKTGGFALKKTKLDRWLQARENFEEGKIDSGRANAVSGR